MINTWARSNGSVSEIAHYWLGTEFSFFFFLQSPKLIATLLPTLKRKSFSEFVKSVIWSIPWEAFNFWADPSPWKLKNSAGTFDYTELYEYTFANFALSKI